MRSCQVAVLVGRGGLGGRAEGWAWTAERAEAGTKRGQAVGELAELRAVAVGETGPGLVEELAIEEERPEATEDRTRLRTAQIQKSRSMSTGAAPHGTAS